MTRHVLIEIEDSVSWKQVPDYGQVKSLVEPITRLLWHHDYYDGAISGLMLWKGEKVWFQMFDEVMEEYEMDEGCKEIVRKYKAERNERCTDDNFIHYDQHRLFNVYRLDPGTIEDLEHDHRIFQRQVGMHSDYDEKDRRDHSGIKPDFLNYYSEENLERRNPRVILETRHVIGQFKF